MVVGASNRLPEDDALGALFDRFLLRVPCDNVQPEELPDVLVAGWKLDLERNGRQPTVTTDDVRQLQGLLRAVDLSAVRGPYVELVRRLRHAGIPVSDRRAGQLQRLVAARPPLCWPPPVKTTRPAVLRSIWDTEGPQAR